MGRVPDAPAMSVRDPWPGDAAIGAKLASQSKDAPFTHVAIVHHETTTGRLNDLRQLTSLCRQHGAALLVDFEKRESAVGFSIAHLTVAQAVRSGLLPRHHRDPFDRLLIAQALDLGIPILSSDRVFDLYGVQRIWE